MNFFSDLKDKNVLITGSSRGIGSACAVRFAEAGCKIGIHYAKNIQAALEVRQSLKTTSEIIQADLSTEAGCQKLITEFSAAFGSLDVLVINHGIWERAPIAEISAGRLDQTLELNLKSLFFLTREAIPVFSSSSGGAIVFISSTAGQRGEANYSHYAASKGGVIALTKSLAVELAPKKIRVNAVAPGWVMTDMTKNVLTGDYLKQVIETIPLRKIARAEDIAPAVVFLASEGASHITGEIININGGSVLCG